MDDRHACSPDFASSRAVLIGVSAYDHDAFPDVPAALRSLHGLYDVLVDPKLCGWPPDRVTVLENPRSGSEVARRLRRLARETEGTLPVYFVGHGTLTERGELCLTLPDTEPDVPEESGLEYEKIRRAFQDTPARTRIAILDCCFSGRAVGLSGDVAQLAECADVQGVYTLAASDGIAHIDGIGAGVGAGVAGGAAGTGDRARDEPRAGAAGTPDSGGWRVAPDDEPGLTSFTGELVKLVRLGVPDRPEWLTLADLFPHLVRRLAVRGLPRPNQRNTDTASLFRFTRNRAGEAAPAVPAVRYPPGIVATDDFTVTADVFGGTAVGAPDGRGSVHCTVTVTVHGSHLESPPSGRTGSYAVVLVLGCSHTAGPDRLAAMRGAAAAGLAALPDGVSFAIVEGGEHARMVYPEEIRLAELTPASRHSPGSTACAAVGTRRSDGGCAASTH